MKDKGDLARASAGSKRFSPGRKKEKREGRQERREPQVPAREACWTKTHERSFLNQIRRRSPAQIHAPFRGERMRTDNSITPPPQTPAAPPKPQFLEVSYFSLPNRQSYDLLLMDLRQKLHNFRLIFDE
ncbi:MAG: hypothetical protein WA231_12155 [Methylocella sp.]